MRSIYTGALFFIMSIGSVIAVHDAGAFVEPTQAPPGGNVVGPLTTGTSPQWRDGTLGIGTSGTASGTLKLDVEGKVGAIEYCDQDGNNCTPATSLGGGGGGGGKFVDGVNPNDAVYTTGYVGIGTTTPSKRLEIQGAGEQAIELESTGAGAHRWSLLVNPSWTPGAFGIYDTTADAARLLINPAGNVGIGQTSPAYNLDVTGDINFTGDIYKNGVLFSGAKAIDDLTDAQKDITNNNLFLGHAGFSGTFYNNLNVGIGIGTLDQPNTNNGEVFYGDANTALGYFALTNNTSGYYNAAQGAYSLASNTTGNYNAAQGSHTLRFNTTGIRNVAQGAYALYSNTTGSYNTVQGTNALRSNTAGSNNVAQGYSALYFNTANNNTAQGTDALRSNTTASNNTAQGYRALYSNTTGGENTATGTYALRANTTADRNTAVGYSALYSNTTGEHNTAQGHRAMYSNSTGSYNTGVGNGTLSSNVTGSANTAVGEESLFLNTTGSDNVAVGVNALIRNETGSSNVAVGENALSENTTAQFNVATGFQSLLSTTTGNDNVGFGTEALKANTTGIGNTAIGGNAFDNSITGSYNTALGFYAGREIAALAPNTDANNSVYIGAYAKASGLGNSNEVVIGDHAKGNGSNSVTLGNDTITKTILRGNVGIGMTDPSATLDVEGNIEIADEGAACDAAHEGQIRYETTLNKHQGCDGTTWNNLY